MSICLCETRGGRENVNLSVWDKEREREDLSVCVRQGEGERTSICLCETRRWRENVYQSVCLSGCGGVFVCLCVWLFPQNKFNHNSFGPPKASYEKFKWKFYSVAYFILYVLYSCSRKYFRLGVVQKIEENFQENHTIFFQYDINRHYKKGSAKSI